jgi:hypothetical protein
MGYTHYWRGTSAIDNWLEASKDAMRLIVAWQDRAVANDRVAFGSDTAKPAVVNTEIIRFNGIGDHGCETFLIKREPSDFDFCKTNRMPYDKLVVAILAMLAGRGMEVSSDGTDRDWVSGVTWASEVLGREIVIPEDVLNDE